MILSSNKARVGDGPVGHGSMGHMGRHYSMGHMSHGSVGADPSFFSIFGTFRHCPLFSRVIKIT